MTIATAGVIEKEVSFLSRESGLSLIKDAQQWQRNYDRARTELVETLVHFYRTRPDEVAKLCEEKIDPNGALLSIVRSIAHSTSSDIPTPTDA